MFAYVVRRLLWGIVVLLRGRRVHVPARLRGPDRSRTGHRRSERHRRGRRGDPGRPRHGPPADRADGRLPRRHRPFRPRGLLPAEPSGHRDPRRTDPGHPPARPGRGRGRARSSASRSACVRRPGWAAGPIGSGSSGRPSSWPRRRSSSATSSSTCSPSSRTVLWGLDILPIGSYEPWDLRYLFLPAITLGIGLAAYYARLTRTALLDELHQDYTRTARAKGASERLVTWRHAFRNALPPMLTQVGLDVGVLLGGVVIVESVFSWPGIGKLALDAVTRRICRSSWARSCSLRCASCWPTSSSTSRRFARSADPPERRGPMSGAAR